MSILHNRPKQSGTPTTPSKNKLPKSKQLSKLQWTFSKKTACSALCKDHHHSCIPNLTPRTQLTAILNPHPTPQNTAESGLSSSLTSQASTVHSPENLSALLQHCPGVTANDPPDNFSPNDFLRIMGPTLPTTYFPCTPTDILHKLWHSNLPVVAVLLTTNTIVWPFIVLQTPNIQYLPIQTVLSPDTNNYDMSSTTVSLSLNPDPTDFACFWLQATQSLPTNMPANILMTSSLDIHRPIVKIKLPPMATGTSTDTLWHDWYNTRKWYQHDYKHDNTKATHCPSTDTPSNTVLLGSTRYEHEQHQFLLPSLQKPTCLP